MIVIDYKDNRPLYEQIVERFQVLIEKGVLKPETQIPSVRSLAMELSINPNTIQKAYAELERRGFIYTVKGRGNFVAYDEELKQKRRKELSDIFQNMVLEAQNAGISRQELLDIIDKVFEKEGGEGD
ncbi:MAG: GntR family transcriptional regulator [Lachnospiraceae bacterium]|nr:GntR family transcriptional regulator [Lachnospiraceae bacterium]